MFFLFSDILLIFANMNMLTFVYILVGLAVLVLLCLLFLYLNKAQTEARPNGKYRLKCERYDGWEERAWYNEKFDTIEEDEQMAVKGVKWVKSYLMPALTYESQIVSYFYTRLNLRINLHPATILYKTFGEDK